MDSDNSKGAISFALIQKREGAIRCFLRREQWCGPCIETNCYGLRGIGELRERDAD
jgi:hypothetical protein